MNHDARLLSTLEALMLDADFVRSGLEKGDGVITALTAVSLALDSGLSIFCLDVCPSHGSSGGIAYANNDSPRTILPFQCTAEQKCTNNKVERPRTWRRHENS